MNITTKLIIPGLALLYSISVANAANLLPKELSADKVTEILEEYRMFNESFVRNSYEKYVALRQGDLQDLERLFPDEEEVDKPIFDFHNPKAQIGIANLSTPLATACYFNNAEFVEWLLKHGADANQGSLTFSGGENLLKLECSKGNTDTAELLVQHGAELTKDEIADLKEKNAYRLTMNAELYNKEMQEREVNAERRESLANDIKACLRTDECLAHVADANQRALGIGRGEKLKVNINTAKLFLKYGPELTEDEIADMKLFLKYGAEAELTENEIADMKEKNAYRLTRTVELYNEAMQEIEFLANEIEECQQIDSLLDEGLQADYSLSDEWSEGE